MEVKVFFGNEKNRKEGFISFSPEGEGMKTYLEKNLIYAFVLDSETDYSGLDEGKVIGMFYGVNGEELFSLDGEGTSEDYLVKDVLGDEEILEELKKVKRVSVRYSRGDWGIIFRKDGSLKETSFFGNKPENLVELWGF